MLATRWNPLEEMQSEMNRLRGEMDRLFGRLGASSRRMFSPTGYPAINMWEDDDYLYLEAELPGMEFDDLEIYVNRGNMLTLSGERKEPTHENGKWHRRERGFGKFSRVLELPNSVDAEKVNAHFKQGVLTIRLPKEEHAKPRRIEVKAE